jgi:hypothetical protein
MKKPKKDSVADPSGNVLRAGTENVFRDTAGNISYIPKFYCGTAAPGNGNKRGDRWMNTSTDKEQWWDGVAWKAVK